MTVQNKPRSQQRCCVVMPAYMEEQRIGDVVRRSLGHVKRHHRHR